MLILILNFLLFSNAVTLRRDKSILFVRTAIISLLFTSFLAYDSLYIVSLKKFTDLYWELFNITTFTLSIVICTLLVGGATLTLSALSVKINKTTNNIPNPNSPVWNWESILTIIAYTIMVIFTVLTYRIAPCGFVKFFDMHYLIPLVSALGVCFLQYVKKVYKGEHTITIWEMVRTFNLSIALSYLIIILVYYVSNNETLAYYTAFVITVLREIFNGFHALSHLIMKDSARIPAGVSENVSTNVKGKIDKGKAINIFMDGPGVPGGSSSNPGNSGEPLNVFIDNKGNLVDQHGNHVSKEDSLRKVVKKRAEIYDEYYQILRDRSDCENKLHNSDINGTKVKGQINEVMRHGTVTEETRNNIIQRGRWITHPMVEGRNRAISASPLDPSFIRPGYNPFSRRNVHYYIHISGSLQLNNYEFLTAADVLIRDPLLSTEDKATLHRLKGELRSLDEEQVRTNDKIIDLIGKYKNSYKQTYDIDSLERRIRESER